MTGEAEAGHIGHGIGVAGQNRRSAGQRPQHFGETGGDGFAQHQVGQAGHRHFGSEHGAGAQGFGQDQRVAGLGAGFGDRLCGNPGDGETDGQFSTLGGVAADDIGTGLAKHFGSGTHHIGQHPGLQGGRQAGQGDLGERHLRVSPHRPDVAHRVHGGQAGHQARIAGEGAQMVGRQHLDAIVGPQDGGVVTGTGQNLGALWARQGRHHGRQTIGADLGPAAATEGFIAQSLGQANDRMGGQGGLRHRGEVFELGHEPAVDAVFHPPEPTARHAQAPFVGDGGLTAQRDQLEVVFLRGEPA